MPTSRAAQPALRCAATLTLAVVVIAGAEVTRTAAQQPAATPTKEDLAKDNKLFLTLAVHSAFRDDFRNWLVTAV